MSKSSRDQDAADDATFGRFLRTLTDADVTVTLAAYDRTLAAQPSDRYFRWSLLRRRNMLLTELARREEVHR